LITHVSLGKTISTWCCNPNCKIKKVTSKSSKQFKGVTFNSSEHIRSVTSNSSKQFGRVLVFIFRGVTLNSFEHVAKVTISTFELIVEISLNCSDQTNPNHLIECHKWSFGYINGTRLGLVLSYHLQVSEET